MPRRWLRLPGAKAPEIVEVQPDLKPINVSGNPAYRVDPTEHDSFKRVIELRQSIKVQRNAARGTEKEAVDIPQKALKIAANATSYGIYVEVNVATRPERVATTVYSSTSEPFSFRTEKVEEPGLFFHPFLATLITGAARLMLATAERLVHDQKLEWCFCATDSIAIARPENVSEAAFEKRTDKIVRWFASLNPYDFAGSILKIEEENFSLADQAKRESLYCWAVSAKRYSLFNLTDDYEPVMRNVLWSECVAVRLPLRGRTGPPFCPALALLAHHRLKIIGRRARQCAARAGRRPSMALGMSTAMRVSLAQRVNGAAR